MNFAITSVPEYVWGIIWLFSGEAQQKKCLATGSQIYLTVGVK